MPAPRPTGPSRRDALGRRRRLGLVAAAAAAAALAAYALGGGRGPAPPPLDPARELVVFLGDSITSGHGLPPEVTFPHRLGAMLGLPVHNAGRSGDTTAGALRRLESEVLARRPRLVVVELGANDAFRRVPRAETLANLRAIVQRTRASGSGVLLLHLTLGPLGGDPYRDGLRVLAQEEGAWLLEDFLDGVVPSLTTDGLHPTAEGHARLAARLLPLLRELLGR